MLWILPTGLPRRRSSRFALLHITSISLITSCSLEPRREPILLLSQKAVYKIPLSFPVSRVALGPNDSIALISKHEPYLLVRRSGGWREEQKGQLRDPIAAAFTPGLGVEVLDATLKAIIRSNTLPEPLPSKYEDQTITSAIRSEHGWIIATSDGDSTAITEVSPHGARDNWRVMLPISRSSAPVLLELQDKWVIIDLMKPWEWTIARPATNDLAVQQIYDTLIAPFAQGDRIVKPLWTAAGLIRVGDFVIYTIADIRSDERLLLLLERDGRIVRMERLQAPMSLAAAQPMGGTLAALRVLNQQELVLYNWSTGSRGISTHQQP